MNVEPLDDLLERPSLRLRLDALIEALDGTCHGALRAALIERYRRAGLTDYLLDLVRRPPAAYDLLAPHVAGMLEDRSILRAVHEWIRWAIKVRRWKFLRELLQALRGKEIRSQLIRLEFDGYWDKLAGLLEMTPQSDDLAECILAIGKPMIPRLALRVPRISSPIVLERWICLMLAISPNSWQSLLKLVTPDTPPAQAINVLTALELAARDQPEFGTFLVQLIDRSDVLSHSDILRFAQSAPASSVREMVARLLKTGTDWTRQMAIQQAEVMGVAGLGTLLKPFLKPSTDPALLLACCRYLRACPESSALAALLDLYGRRPGFLKFGRTLSAEIRAAVVMAVAAIKCPKSREIIEEASKSKEPEIRAAARAGANPSSRPSYGGSAP